MTFGGFLLFYFTIIPYLWDLHSPDVRRTGNGGRVRRRAVFPLFRKKEYGAAKHR